MNTYVYVYNNPLKYVDPLGLEGKIYYPVPNIPTIPGTPSYDLAKPLTKFFNNIYNNSSSDEAESCPSTDKDNWEKIPGSNQAYKPKGKKEPIFEKDRAGDRGHGGSAWKKWDKRRDWENGKDRNGTYDVNGQRLRD